jgi:hypothetical protein
MFIELPRDTRATSTLPFDSPACRPPANVVVGALEPIH